MADLPVRRGGGAGAQNDPFQMVRESMRRMQDLFRDPSFELDPAGFFGGGQLAQFIPDFEVRETKEGLVFQADLPGVKEDDLDITVVGNRLRISGKREFQQETRGDTWYAAERSYGNFTRSFILPEGCDTNNVDANLQDGVLTIRLGKRQESQPRRISLGGRQALEGQYSQGPFHQSAGAGEQNAGQAQRPAAETGQGGQKGGEGGQKGVEAGQKGGEGAYGKGYGGMYGGQTPEAGREYGAAAGGFEHGEQAGGATGPGYAGGADAGKRRADDKDKG